MDIGCSCSCGNEGEVASVSTIAMRKARKTHVCTECGEKIEKGEKYEYVAGLWDGHWDTFKTCNICLRIRKDVCCDGFVYGELREIIREEFYLDYVTGEFLKPSRFVLWSQIEKEHLKKRQK